jgi:hypothetical protein
MRGVVRNPRRWSVFLIPLGVVIGEVFFAALPAGATTSDGDVVLGAAPPITCTSGTDANCASSPTGIVDVTTGDTAFNAYVLRGGGDAIFGDNYSGNGPGVHGASYSGNGVAGYSPSGGAGVYGSAGAGDGVVGDLPSWSTGTNGVTGSAENGGNGVNAESNSPYTIGRSGHFNAALFAQNTSTGTALWARNLNNGGEGAHIEAWGSASTALNVCGCNGATALNVSGPTQLSGLNVSGATQLSSLNASGPTQLSSLNVSGSAQLSSLHVSGQVQLSRSGVATVAGSLAAPKNSVNVSVSQITSKSIMTATLQKYVSGVFVVAAVPNVSGGYFTIYLNKAVTTSVGPIAWEVIEHP